MDGMVWYVMDGWYGMNWIIWYGMDGCDVSQLAGWLVYLHHHHTLYSALQPVHSRSSQALDPVYTPSHPQQVRQWPGSGSHPTSPPQTASTGTSSLSVTSCISEWEQRVPQDRHAIANPAQYRALKNRTQARTQGLPSSLSRRRGRCWERAREREEEREVPDQTCDLDLEEQEGAYMVSESQD